MMKRRTLIVTWFPKTLLTTRPTVSQMMLNLKKKSVTPAQMTSQTMTMMVRATTVRNVCLRTVKLLGVRLRILTHTEDDLKVILLEKKRGLAASIGDLSSPVEALNCFLDEDFYSRVTNHTNQELVRVIAKMTYEDKHNYRYREFSVDETRAAVGLLLLAGVTSARRESLEQLWDEKRGRSIFRATMSCTRFKVFLLAARFDDKTSRHTRRETDKLAPIRELFDSFVSKCKQLYTMSPFVCVDECLLGFRGRCSFRVYMPSKPAKYGLKVWMLCDVGTSFAGNLQVYLGKESTGLPEKGQGARVVKDLCGYIFNSGRNVTTDNFFTSYSLSQELLTKNLTLLGTMRQNRPELPPAMLPKKREQYDSIFGFTNDAMLVSYAPRRNRTVAVLSTMHDSIEVDTLTEEKSPTQSWTTIRQKEPLIRSTSR